MTGIRAFFLLVSLTVTTSALGQSSTTVSLDPTSTGAFAWPQFLVTNGDLAFVVGSDTHNIAVVDLAVGQVVRYLPLREDMAPYRIEKSDAGRVAVSGGKYVAMFDTDGLVANPAIAVNISILCVIDCSRAKPDAGTTAVVFPADADLPIAAALDRVTDVGALYQVDPKSFHNIYSTLDGTDEEIMEIYSYSSTDDANVYALPADVSTTAGVEPMLDITIQATSTELDLAVRLNEVALVGDAEGMVYTKDNIVLVVDQDESMVRAIDYRTGELKGEAYVGIPQLTHPFDFVPFSGDSMDIALSSDRSTAYVSNVRSNTIAVLDTEDMVVVKLIDLPGTEGGPYGITVSPNGKYILAAGWGSNHLFIVDIATGTTEAVAVGARPVDVDVSSAGVAVVTNSEDNPVSLVTPSSSLIN